MKIKHIEEYSDRQLENILIGYLKDGSAENTYIGGLKEAMILVGLLTPEVGKDGKKAKIDRNTTKRIIKILSETVARLEK